MVACIIALIVLAFMALFSAKYRVWFREALSCVTRRFVLKSCNTGFDSKVKSVVTAKLLKKNVKMARFTHKYFEAISWIFMIIFVVSLVFTAYGLYNIAVYGSCDPQNPDMCVLTPGISSCSHECPEGNCQASMVPCDTCGRSGEECS